MKAPGRVRCAIYTRKSSEEGLEQGFNSLHAQREACEAYVLSQAGEGWVALSTIYDDGGFSGGSMDRPALTQLMADVSKGLIDVIVVYKVDRLTRSLTDFARIVDILDKAGSSFVSVTQAFNTTTSMGRLTLNVLLSFAQFEREVTGERIRDKIAASKARGMWMGGNLPLGYDPPTDPQTRALVINPAEAETVRLIFDQYLTMGSVHALRAWLEERGIRSKSWTSTRGRQMGGATFSRGALFHLLKNRVYLGHIPHKTLSYPGAHPPIIDPDTFERVQQGLRDRTRERKGRTTTVRPMILKGLLFDDRGRPMSPCFTRKGPSKIYRYYVSTSLLRGEPLPPDPEAIRRVPSDAIEDLVIASLQRLTGQASGTIAGLIGRVDILPQQITLLIKREALSRKGPGREAALEMLRPNLQSGETLRLADDAGLLIFTLPIRLKVRGGRVWLSDPFGKRDCAKPDPTLIAGLKAAHALLRGGRSGTKGGMGEAPQSAYDRILIRMAFLAPDIQSAILEGRQPRGLTLHGLLNQPLPAAWSDQRAALGFP
jgi:site-specific DNA recombinase